MKPENPDEALLEQSLAAWNVPEPPPGLTDRILAQNAEPLGALSTPATQTEPPVALKLKEDRPAMLPTDLRAESSMRPFWTATVFGFAAAAAVVLAFMAGRQSTTSSAPAPAPTVVPSVEIQVSTPAPFARPSTPPQPPAPPRSPAPPAAPEKLSAPEPTAPVSPTAKSDGIRHVRRVPDLRNPFGSTQSPPPTPAVEDGEGQPLQDPFTVGRATLRLGTHAGSAPAQVSVDGKPVGRTPIASLKVSPGKHTVVFRWGNMTRSFKLDVEAGEVRVVRADDK